MTYLGWFIYRIGPHWPVTGQWRAVRHGVEMGAGTREALGNMIEQRKKDDDAYRTRVLDR